MTLSPLADATTAVRTLKADAPALRLEVETLDGCRRTVLHNDGAVGVAIDEIVIASIPHTFPHDTPLYGEGFQMLSQYGGTVRRRESIGRWDDRDHYRLAERDDCVTVYNLALFEPTDAPAQLLAFTTCERFSGQIRVYADRVEAVLLTEGLVLGAHQSWALEDVVLIDADSGAAALAALVSVISAAYPAPPVDRTLTGWCSWYWFLDDLTTDDILENAALVSERQLPLEFVQIDDGYEAKMGDWFVPKPGVAETTELFASIRAAGREPAIWVAPFIAEPTAQVVQDHPDWFLSRPDGTPLPSDEVTFGGWREPGWLMFDFTNPAALEHLRGVFERMRNEWDCRYFKMDALAWGAFPFGARHDPSVTSVEAYRAAMRVIRDAVGPESILLGCNAPMWPSLGLVDVMRTTSDIERDWAVVRSVADEGLHRSWQHGRLWQIDPDCLLLVNKPGTRSLSQDELDFHAAFIFASGGSILSGDDLRVYDDAAFERLRALAAADRPAASFDAKRMTGSTVSGGRRWQILMNPTDKPVRLELSAGDAVDFWSGEAVAADADGRVTLRPHSARILGGADHEDGRDGGIGLD